MQSRHRRLKTHHLIFIYLGGWSFLLVPLLFLISFYLYSDSDQHDSYWDNPYPLFLLFGFLIMVIINAFQKHRTIKILKKGQISEARLIQKIRVSSVDNESQERYKYNFEFFDEEEKRHEFSFKSTGLRRLEDEDSEMIIYLAENPRKAIALDSLPWPLNKYVKKNWTAKPIKDKNSFIQRN